jgi:hypothetical protein
MKYTFRLNTLAITALALVASAGVLGAQQRNNGRSAPRAQVSRAQVSRAQAPRAQTSRTYAEGRARQDVRGRSYAPQARPEVRGRNEFAARPEVRGRNDFAARSDVRGRDARLVPVAAHGRPLITRGAYGRPAFVGGIRYGAGFNRFGGRLALPFGWESRMVVRGFFPVSYMSYCEPVPVDYEYMLPEMLPNYDSCLFGDRVIVMDRYSRGIVFAAVIQ